MLAVLLCMAAGCGGNKAATTSNDAAATTGSTSGAPAEMKVAAVSQYDAGPRAFEAAADDAGAKRGEQLFKDKGCSACHAFGRKVTGPDLAGVTHRRTAAWIENQILHPEVMVKTDPISHELYAKYMLQMPNQGLTRDEAGAVIAYFRHMDHEAGEAHAKEEGK
jgi:mono/diheme cytochrome c family protein